VQHDTTVGCRQEKVEEVFIKTGRKIKILYALCMSKNVTVA